MTCHSPTTVTTNEQMTHVRVGRRNLPERRGRFLRILVARKGKFAVEFADGWRVVTVRDTFRKRPA
jgi:hypothetical protein